MNMKPSTKYKFHRIFANILSIVAIFAIAFPVTGNVYAVSISSNQELFTVNTLDLEFLVAAAQEEGSLTVIALPNDWCNYGEVIAGFTDMYGIPVNSVAPSASSEDELQAIRDGGPDAPDVIDVGPGFAVQAMSEGLITPYQVSTWGTIPEFMKDSEGYWYGDYYGVMAIAANTTSYASPTSWDDLLNGSDIGPVALGGDPMVSNLGFFSVYASALANGGSLDDIESGVNFFRDLNNAGRLLPDIGNGDTLASGATPVLPEWSYLALAQRDANPDAQIEVVVPQPNPIASFYAQAVSAYAPHPNAAQLWMEYLYSDAGQVAFLEGYCFPARYEDLLARDVIPGDLLSRLPDITGAVFPSLDQIVNAKDFVESNWNCIVYDNGCSPSPWRDEFDGSLGDGWYWVNEDANKWEFGDSFLRIYASPYEVDGPQANKLMRSVSEHDFAIETHVFFEPQTNFQFAGLSIYQDDDNLLSFGRAFCDIEGPCVGNGIYFDHIGGGTWVDGNFGTVVNSPNEAYLRLERRGDMVRALYSYEGITWFEIGTHWIPSNFQVDSVGLIAVGDIDKSDDDIHADFEYFELTDGWGFLPEGFHDYDGGDVPNWACNVGGWAADPDDRATDLAIEVDIDDTPLSDWLYAGEYREDLDNAGVCVDGNCAFSTSLWDKIALYEPHSVVVYAQDIPSGEWVRLSNSPKDLTCRTYDIYTFDPATGTTKQITNLPDMHEFNPRWSPDAKKIVHDAWNMDWSAHGIYITDVQTGVSTPLVGAEGGSYPTWSPSGKWIAFDRGADNDNSIFIVPPTGGTPRLVREDAFMASWAPNSNRLAFQQPSDGSIRTVSLDGDSETIVTEYGNGPAWSPDGAWIAFEKDGDVWKIPVNKSGAPVGDPIQLTSTPLWEGRPTWSYNSKTIAFHAGMGQDTDIWTIPAAGGEATWLTGAPNFGDYDANYSLKGKSTYISYSSFSPEGQSARIWIANFSYDVGTWTEGEHSYYFENTYLVPEPWNGITDPITFNVTTDTRTYNGYVLLRTFGLRARAGSGCPAIDPLLHPEQNTRFGYGWLTDYPMTYAEALDHFNSMMVKAYWDDGMSAELQRHEIFPSSSVDFGEIVCASTEAPPEPDLQIMTFPEPNQVFGYGWPVGSEVSLSINGEYITTVNVQGAPWDENDIMAFFDFGEVHDLVAGDEVMLSGSGMELTYTVQNLSVTEVNADANVVAGTADDGALVYAGVHEWWDVTEMQLTADDGGWLADFGSLGFDLAKGMCGRAEIRDQFGNSTAVDWCIPNTRFTVFPEWEWFDGYEWPDGATVEITVLNKPECTTSKESFDGFFNGNFGEGCDVVVGDNVTFTDGETTLNHIVQNIAITGVDKEANTVSGTADVGALVYAWVHEYGYDMELLVEDGTWFADFGSAGLNIVENMGGRAEIRDEFGNSTAVDWWIPNPHFSVFPEWEYIEGWQWPDGALVTAEVDGKPECYAEEYSGHPDWDPNELFVPIWFPEGCDVAVDDLVTLTDGATIRTHIVQNLAITSVDMETNIVSGTADTGAEVHVWAHGYDELFPTTDEDGIWFADFGSIGIDLVKGMGGRTEIRDEVDNATAVEWRIPDTRFTVWPEWNYLEGYDWPEGALVSISVAGKEVCSTEAVSDSWDMSFSLNFPEGCTIEVGDAVTLASDALSLTHAVQSLAITEVNADADTVTGTAAFDPEQYYLHGWIHGIDESEMQLFADIGTWLADFGSQAFDLKPGMGGRVELVDQNSNATAVEWYIPNPRIVASITEDWFYTQEFAPNTELDFAVYASQGGALVSQGTTTITDGSGFVWVNAEGRWDLEPGNYIVVSDGTSMKDLVIEGFTFDVFNAANGQLSGTAPVPYGRNVWVGIGFENDVWDMEVTTDGTGAWFADFGQPVPTDYWWVAAQLFDDDGDSSELRPASQIIFLRPACGDNYTVQAGSLLEIRYGSWVAIGEDLAIQNAEHLTVELVLNGETVTGAQQPVVPRSEIPCGIPLDNRYGVYYVAQVGPLSPGIYTAQVTYIFDEAVTDGYDANGDGEPDWYGPGVLGTREFTIIVQ